MFTLSNSLLKASSSSSIIKIKKNHIARHDQPAADGICLAGRGTVKKATNDWAASCCWAPTGLAALVLHGLDPPASENHFPRSGRPRARAVAAEQSIGRASQVFVGRVGLSRVHASRTARQPAPVRGAPTDRTSGVALARASGAISNRLLSHCKKQLEIASLAPSIPWPSGVRTTNSH